jgi:hypothetical protein
MVLAFTCPTTGATTSRARPATVAPGVGSALFKVVRRLDLGPQGPIASLVDLEASSVFLTGDFTGPHDQELTLVRVDRRRFTVVAGVAVPDLSSVAYGNGAVWAGTEPPKPPYAPAPPAERQLLRLNAANLGVTARFEVPGTPLLVAVVRGELWVVLLTSRPLSATPARLARIDTTTGAVLATVTLDLYPLRPCRLARWRRLVPTG